MIELLPGKYQATIRRIYRFTFWALGLGVAYILAVSFNLFYLFGSMPSLKALENPKSEVASEVISADNQAIGKYFLENRTPVEFSQLSPNIVKALMSIEDARFSQHSGIDPRSLFRAALGILTFNSGSGGGSTLTQQLAKNLFELRQDEKYQGLLHHVPIVKMVVIKTKEWITAISLERRYTKQEIMTMYLNTVSFGSNAYGIRSATRTFFSKEPWEVNVEEAAVLMGMLQNPSRYNPRFHPESALGRRNTVLAQMVKYGYLAPAQFEVLSKKTVNLKYRVENHNIGLAPYLLAVIKDDLQSVIDEINKERSEEEQLDLYTSGLKIRTSIDSRMQRYAVDAVEEHMKKQQGLFFDHWKGRNPWCDDSGKEIKGFIEGLAKQTQRYRSLKELYESDEAAIWKVMNTPTRMRVFSWAGERDTTLSPMDSIRYYKNFLNIGFMAMEPSNGHVKAWVGGINFKYFKFDHVRQSKRQPGSTFKPFLYATAIDNGYTPCDKVTDRPVSFTLADGVPGGWTPKNSDGGYSYQTMTLRRALAKSINTVSAHLMKQFKPKLMAEYAHRIGIESDLVEKPSLCLGASDVSVYEMVSAYSTFANSGTYTEPIVVLSIEDRFGNTLKEFMPKQRDAISSETAYLMVHMLKGALEEPGGTAQGLKRYACSQNNEIGAKTGTTSNQSDAWFMGITKNLVGGCWVGGDNRSIHFRSLALGQGARLAMPAWAMFMDKVYADPTIALKKEPFVKPASMTFSFDCSGYGGISDDSTAIIIPTQKPSEQNGLLQ